MAANHVMMAFLACIFFWAYFISPFVGLGAGIVVYFGTKKIGEYLKG